MMSSESGLDLEFVKNAFREHDHQKAFDYLIDNIQRFSDDQILIALDALEEASNQRINISAKAIGALKQFFSADNETIQELAVDLYLKLIKKKPSLFGQELDYCLGNVFDFDPNVREKFCDFFIAIIKASPKFGKNLLQVIINCLKDNSWKIRLKLVSFLKNSFEELKPYLGEYKEQIFSLINEPDLDVLADVLELLYFVFTELSTDEDSKKIFSLIKGGTWFQQERLLWLIGKVGINNPEKIKPYRKELIKFLEHNDLLVQQRAVQMFSEIVQHHPDIFDIFLIEHLMKESTENIEGVETIFYYSIVAFGAERFLTLYFDYARKDYPHLFPRLKVIIRRLAKEDSKLFEDIMEKWINLLLEKNIAREYKEADNFLAKLNQYNIYYPIYQYLNKILPKFTKVDQRNALKMWLATMVEKIPELDYLSLAKWINNKLEHENLALEDVADYMGLSIEKLSEILQHLMEKGHLNAYISENILHKLTNEDSPISSQDIQILKKWRIIATEQSMNPDIHFMIKIINNSNVPLRKINIICANPHDMLVHQSDSDSTTISKNTLMPGEAMIVHWIFGVNENVERPKNGYLQIIIFYRKQDEMNSITKKLDILAI